MAKKMTPDESAAIIKNLASKIDYIEDPSKPARVPVVKFQMGLPSDILGSQVTFSNGAKTSLEATALGIVMRSKGNRRKVLVPWANVKAAEFSWDVE